MWLWPLSLKNLAAFLKLIAIVQITQWISLQFPELLEIGKIKNSEEAFLFYFFAFRILAFIVKELNYVSMFFVLNCWLTWLCLPKA